MKAEHYFDIREARTRISDLERQLAKAQAEIERLDESNKSLMQQVENNDYLYQNVAKRSLKECGVLKTEIERMRPVVEAAIKKQLTMHGYMTTLIKAISDYEAKEPK